MNRTAKIITVLGLFLAVALGILYGKGLLSVHEGLDPPASLAALKLQNPPKPAPDVAFYDAAGGRHTLAEYRGRYVLMNFWATWCAPCVKEMPELSALHDAHEDVQVVGLTYEQIELETLRKALARRPVSYPIASVDPYEMPPGIAAPRGLPMTYLIDPQGNVKREFLGPVTRADIERAIAAT
jgi:thiol-disulfide isomerase/thioredoxin